MSNDALYRWVGGAFAALDYCDPGEYRVEAMDSFLVTHGRIFARELHESRFFEAARQRGNDLDGFAALDLEAFWDAALALVPADGNWFPRVELQSKDGAAHLVFRHRPAPEPARSAVLATLDRPDPRKAPGIKGPDVDALLSARTRARRLGADDAVILTSDGFIVDGTTSALVWWRGDILCAPPLAEDAREFERVDSVTARSLFAMAAALGVETHRERATPADLDGAEVWALGAVHGIRIVTSWVGGPKLAESPGRLGLWRHRREALHKPIGGTGT
ncbi:MAG TPA: aminotransferase class IV [Terrimesophilobacter sp.]|nr:aminotransferase class IV [Terrimesophilobacter sp.]